MQISRFLNLFLICITLLGLSALSYGGQNCLIRIKFDDPITVASLDYFQRAKIELRDQNCFGLLLEINTPGGDLQTTRKIVELILNSETPTYCWITPKGGRAGSAGALILQSCHGAYASTSTNLGAATPVSGGGQQMPEDLRRKVLNDTKSWAEGFVKLRGRNVKAVIDMIEKGEALESRVALEQGVIDAIIDSEESLISKISEKDAELASVVIRDQKKDLRYQVLNFVADPELAYMMFLGSLALLYFGITHAGTFVPEILGGAGFILSMIVFHKLEVQWGGVALILFGVALLIAEIFITSFGILGIGGLVSLFFGSLFLFDPQTGYQIPLHLILGVVGSLATIILAVGYLFIKALKKNKAGDFLHDTGRVTQLTDGRDNEGQLEIDGEIWSFKSEGPVKIGDQVKVKQRDGLHLMVIKE